MGCFGESRNRCFEQHLTVCDIRGKYPGRGESLASPGGISWARLRYPIRLGIGPVLEYVEAGQQEPRGEIPPVDAPINRHRAAFHSLGAQRFRQLPITPSARCHRTLHQHAGFERPILHRLGLGLGTVIPGVKGYRTSKSLHLTLATGQDWVGIRVNFVTFRGLAVIPRPETNEVETDA